MSSLDVPYWVEAINTPFLIQFGTEEEDRIADATESLGAMCKEFLDWFFEDQQDGAVDARLSRLGIKPEYWEAIKASWEREGEEEDLSLYLRFDLAIDGTTPPKLLEINGETPLLQAEMVYQWNWLEDMKRLNKVPQNSSQFNDFWDLVAAQMDFICRHYHLGDHVLSFLVDGRLEEDIEAAAQLIQIVEDRIPGQHCQLVYLQDQFDRQGNLSEKGLGLDDDGDLIDGNNQKIRFLWKMYDWSDLQNDVEAFGKTGLFAAGLLEGRTKFFEPLWKQVLSNKGALVYIYELFKDHSEYGQYLLATYFEDDLRPEVTSLMCRTHVRKPLLGLEGVATEIRDGSLTVAERESFGYGQEGFILQQYAPLPEALGYHYMVGSWLIGGLDDGKLAGFVIRGDKSQITGRYCLIIPHIISDTAVV